MDKEQFGTEMDRLKGTFDPTQRIYTDERVKLLYGRFYFLTMIDFGVVVDRLIMTRIRPPLVKEISDEVDVILREKKQAAAMPGITLGLENIPDCEDTNRDVIKMCRRLLKNFQTGQMTFAEFLKACDSLDRLIEQITERKTA